MLTLQPICSNKATRFNPATILIPKDPPIDPYSDFMAQTIPNGTTVTRPSDGCQWTIAASWPYPGWPDRITLQLTQVTPVSNPPQVILSTDTLNIGS